MLDKPNLGCVMNRMRGRQLLVRRQRLAILLCCLAMVWPPWGSSAEQANVNGIDPSRPRTVEISVVRDAGDLRPLLDWLVRYEFELPPGHDWASLQASPGQLKLSLRRTAVYDEASLQRMKNELYAAAKDLRGSMTLSQQQCSKQAFGLREECFTVRVEAKVGVDE